MPEWLLDVLWFAAMAVSAMAAFWVPIGLVLLYHSQVEEVRSGERPNTSVVLGVFATLAGSGWILMMLFFVLPHAVTETIPNLYNFIKSIATPIFGWLFTGVSGAIVAAVFGLLVLTAVLVFVGWALRVGWNLHKEPRAQSGQHERSP